MKISFEMEYEHNSFSTLGPTPYFSWWIGFKRGIFERRYRGIGFSIAFGINPLRLAWNGIWKIGAKHLDKPKDL